MALSIKDEETDALVRQLARARHLSYTGAIKLAVRNELAKDPKPAPITDEERERRMAVVREIQQRWRSLPQVMSAEEVDDWLYDENGLPR